MLTICQTMSEIECVQLKYSQRETLTNTIFRAVSIWNICKTEFKTECVWERSWISFRSDCARFSFLWYMHLNDGSQMCAHCTLFAFIQFHHHSHVQFYSFTVISFLLSFSCSFLFPKCQTRMKKREKNQTWYFPFEFCAHCWIFHERGSEWGKEHTCMWVQQHTLSGISFT